MDIVQKMAEIDHEAKATDFGDLSAVYYNKIAPSIKSTDYLGSNIGWVFACNQAIADEVAKTEFKLYKATGEKVEEITEHPILDVLYRANNFTTQHDLMWLIASYIYLAGEAPLFVLKKGKTPEQLFLLRPDRLSVKAGEAGELISGYTYRNEKGRDIPIEYSELVFLKRPDPRSTFRGQGVLSAIARVVDIEQYSEEYNRNFFYNSATPSITFSTEKTLTKDTRDRFRKQIEENYKGVRNAHKFLILESGLSAAPLQVSQKDMEFFNQLNWTRDKILAVSRVPRTALGITDDVNRANAEATDYVFIKRTIYPLMKMITAQLNEFFVPLFPDGKDLYLDFENPITQDIASKISYYNSGVTNGWLSVNEIREMEGLSNIGPEGDKFGRASDVLFGAGYKKQIVKRLKLRNRTASFKYLQSQIKNEVEKEVAKMRPEIAKAIKAEDDRREQESRKWSYEQKVNDWNEIIKRADRFEMRFRSAIERQFKKQADIVLSGKEKAVNKNDWLLDLDKEKQIWFRILLPIYSDVVREQGQRTLDQLADDLAFNMNREFIQNFLFYRTSKIAKDLNVETNKRIGKILADNVSENEAVISRKIREMFDDMTNDRAKVIARTETFKAVNIAKEESYKQSGVVEAKEWFTALDERVCEFCGPMEGKIIRLGQNFHDKGDVVDGADGGEYDASYDNVSAPPLHPSCRCTLAPVLIARKNFEDALAKAKKESDRGVELARLKASEKTAQEVKKLNKKIEAVDKKAENIRKETDAQIGQIAESVDQALKDE